MRPVLFAPCLALLFACASEPQEAKVAPEAAPEVSYKPITNLSVLIAKADRSVADRARDEGRKPAEVLTFLGLEPGMVAVDLIAAGGWYTEVISSVVGSEGRVYAQNPAMVLKFRDGANDKALTARLAGDRLPNVSRLDVEIAEMDIAPESVDLVLTALNFHDVYNRDPAQAQGLSRIAYGILKPGGVFGVIDHDGNDGADNAALHRMQKSQAIEVLERVGFEVSESDLLSNVFDDRSQFVFAEGLRGKTDRFLLKATKPGGPEEDPCSQMQLNKLNPCRQDVEAE